MEVGAEQGTDRPGLSLGQIRAVLGSRAIALSRAMVDLLAPPLCPVTGAPVAHPGLLSPEAWADIQFIDDPVCAGCGAPFAFDEGAGARCGACIAEPPAFDGARAAVVYGEASHRLIVAFKHADRTDLAPLLVGWLLRAARPVLRADSLIVPCPLHPLRLLQRRYNQAALLAAGLARATGVPLAVDALRRVKRTAPQQSLSAAARRRNVAAAFSAAPRAASVLAGRRVILVDDVLTTGATLSAAARALKKAGAARVDAVVVARVSRSGAATIGG
jgi:ComF family protein